MSLLRKGSQKILNSAQDFVGNALNIQFSVEWGFVHFP